MGRGGSQLTSSTECVHNLVSLLIVVEIPRLVKSARGLGLCGEGVLFLAKVQTTEDEEASDA